MFRGQVRKLAITILFALGAVGFLLSVNVVFDHMADHQKNRILVALGITEDPRGAGYNVNQSVIAIGSGGMTGKGFLNGTQTKLKYVPEQHTDFIFCTIGEEEGFIGTTTVLGLFVLLILRIVSLAERQPTTFARVYGYCVASFLYSTCSSMWAWSSAFVRSSVFLCRFSATAAHRCGVSPCFCSSCCVLMRQGASTIPTEITHDKEKHLVSKPDFV